MIAQQTATMGAEINPLTNTVDQVPLPITAAANDAKKQREKRAVGNNAKKTFAERRSLPKEGEEPREEGGVMLDMLVASM